MLTGKPVLRSTLYPFHHLHFAKCGAICLKVLNSAKEDRSNFCIHYTIMGIRELGSATPSDEVDYKHDDSAVHVAGVTGRQPWYKPSFGTKHEVLSTESL